MTAQGASENHLRAGHQEPQSRRCRDDGPPTRPLVTRQALRSALVACPEPGRRSRFALRWLHRLLEEDDRLSIEEALAASALVTLGGRGHAEALATLSARAEKATRNASSAAGSVLSGPHGGGATNRKADEGVLLLSAAVVEPRSPSLPPAESVYPASGGSRSSGRRCDQPRAGSEWHKLEARRPWGS